MSDENNAGGITTFNIQNGFVEALVRGYRSGFLLDGDYHRIVQCETLEGEECASAFVQSPHPCWIDIKLNLQETDYGQFLGNEVS